MDTEFWRHKTAFSRSNWLNNLFVNGSKTAEAVANSDHWNQMTQPAKYISEPYSETRLLFPCLALAVAGFNEAFRRDASWYWFVIAVLPFLLGLGFNWRATIDTAARTVVEQLAVFDRGKLRCRLQSLDNFEAIVFDRLDHDPEDWGVGIRHRLGRRIWIKRCGPAAGQRPPGRASEEFAWRLSWDTGLPIEDYKPNETGATSVRTWLVWLIVLGGILSIPYCNHSSSDSEVIIYAAQDQVYAEPILREFEKETGLKVKAVYDSEAVKTVGLANRLLAERAHPQCDVFWGNEEMRTRQLAAQNVFRETNGWAAFGYRSRRLVLHDFYEDHIYVRSGPDSLLELTNEWWRGRVVMAFPQFGTTATHFHALKQLWGEEQWLAWCRALASNKPFIVDGNSVVVKFVARSEADIGLTDSDDIDAGRRERLPVHALPLNRESLLIPNTVAVIRSAPHPKSAQRLFDYLQRSEVVDKLVKAGALEGATIPTNTPTLKPGWDALLRDLEKTTKQLNEIFLR